MAEKHPKIVETAKRIERLKSHSAGSSLQLLPLSHIEFQARWSLNKDSIASGLRAASGPDEESRLILRVYSLPLASDHSDFSNIWHDYRVEKRSSSAFFSLPKPAAKINAAIGLSNKSGRFIPLVRGNAIALPPLPDPPPEKKAEETDHWAPRERGHTYQSRPANATPRHGKTGEKI